MILYLDTTSRYDEFQCLNKERSIKYDQFCDSHSDCSDGSDEIVYNASSHAAEDGIPCRSESGRLCLLPTNQSHKKEHLCLLNTTCANDEFECTDKQTCVKRSWFCDGYVDCSDQSDEIIYNTSVHTAEHGIQCRSVTGSLCLLANQSYKKDDLCRSDEACRNDEFECTNRQRCIRRTWFCDGTIDCSDLSDEIIYNASIHKEEDGIPCRSKNSVSTCLLPANQADKKDKFCQQGLGCDVDEFECLDGSQCIPLYQFCNGQTNCRDGSDDILIHSSKNVEGGIACKRPLRTCLLPSKYVDDGIQHCTDNSDECFSKNKTRPDGSYSANQCFQCLDHSSRISASNVCNGIFDCDDLSDECLCLSKVSETKDPIQKVCEKVIKTGESTDPCFSEQKICDGSNDCKDKEDERYCGHSALDEACSDNTLDENTTAKEKCDFECADYAFLSEVVTISIKKGKRCDGRITCHHDVKEEECMDCPNSPSFCPYLKSWFEFICSDEQEAIYLFQLCDGIPDCSNKRDELLCPDKFYCKEGETIHIPQENKCDLISDCSDESDEMDCNDHCKTVGNNSTSKCNVTHFYCNDGEDPKYMDTRKVCDGNQDCATGVDECQGCTDKVFSDDESMISSKPMLPFLWIISGFAVLGNAFVIIFTISSLRKKRGKLSKNELAQNILVLSLSVSDLLVGVYTTIIGIVNIFLSKDQYCLQDQDWRSGILCSTLGVILMTGTEASVFTLTVITALRIRGVVRPFSQNSFRGLSVIILLCWVASIAFAVVPLFTFAQDYFVERIWYKQNPFFTFIEQEQIEKQAEVMIAFLKVNSTFHEDIIGKKYSWSLIEALISKIDPTYKASRRFGYYSTHGVCLPRLFPSMQEKSWGFSLTIIVINFILFFFILAGYVVVYKKATNSSVRGTGAEMRAAKLQRKIARIVASDLLCWMPICIMGFIQLSGIDISTDVYVPTGMIILPVNSALNPFLYSDGPEWLGKKLGEVINWIRSHIPNTGSRILDPLYEMEEICAGNHGNAEPRQEEMGSNAEQGQQQVLNMDDMNCGNLGRDKGMMGVNGVSQEKVDKQQRQVMKIGRINGENAQQQPNSLKMEGDMEEMNRRMADQQQDSVKMDDANKSSVVTQNQRLLNMQKITDNESTQQHPEMVVASSSNQENVEQDLVEMDEENHGIASKHHNPGLQMTLVNRGSQERQHGITEMGEENQQKPQETRQQ